MRATKSSHIPLHCQYSNHEFSDKLKSISKILDRHDEVLELVMNDLGSGNDERGAKGMTAENVLRAALLKQLHQWSFDTLAYHIQDSMDTRAFIRCDITGFARSTLQGNITSISAETWEAINRCVVVEEAQESGIDKGRKVRIDATVVPTNIHNPTDSTLVIDCLRVLERMRVKALSMGIKLSYLKLSFKKAKKIAFKILNAKNSDERLTFYQELLLGADDARKAAHQWFEHLSEDSTFFEHLQATLHNMDVIIYQAVERVLNGKSVQSSEKIVSIFEDHTDVIVKSRRETEFGHKVFFSTGESNLVLDCKITEGNPSDKVLMIPMLKRLAEIYRRPPRQVAVDGGFSSHENLEEAKSLGVSDVCLSKHRGIERSEMVRSNEVFKKLRSFRAGVESNISCLKRSYGLGLALWKGFTRYKSYVWANIVAYNLKTLVGKC